MTNRFIPSMLGRVSGWLPRNPTRQTLISGRVNPIIQPLSGYALIVLWGLLMLVLAYYIYRREGVTDTREFITAGARAELGLATASFAVTWMWAGDILGVPEYVGFVGVSSVWMYAAPAVLSAFVVIPFALRMRKLFPRGFTYSEYFIERFGPVSHLVVIFVVMYTMILGGVIQLYVGGVVVGDLTGIGSTVVMALMMLIIGVYILLGGLWGSMTTDFVQFISAIILTLVFVPFLVVEVGGLDAVYTKMVSNLGDKASSYLSMAHFAPAQDFFLPYALGLGVWGVVSLATWQRIFAVRRDRISRFLTIGGIGVFTTICMYSVIGFVGLAAFPEVSPGDLSVESLSLLPAWAAVAFLLVVLMVLGSSTDSYLTALASLTSRDIYHWYVNPGADDRSQLMVARVASLFFAAVIFVATLLALDRVGFITLLLIGGIGATALVGPFALSLFWRRTSGAGFVTGAVVSQIVTAYLLFGNASLPLWYSLKLWEIMAVGHIVSTLLTFLVSLVFADNFDFESLRVDQRETVAPGGEAV